MWKISDVIACQSSISHSTIAAILKNKNQETEAVKGPASLQAKRLTKSEKGYIRPGETSGDLD